MTAPLETLTRQIDKAVPAAQAPFIRAVAETLFDKASPEFIADLGPESLLAITLGALRLVEEHRPGQVQVRLYNPRFQSEGWDFPGTAVEVLLEDRPFLVDSVRNELRRQGLRIDYQLHPVLRVGRRQDGELDLVPEAGTTLSYQLCLVERVEEPQRLEGIRQALARVLEDVVLATDDYRPMLARAGQARDYLRGLARGADPERAEELAEQAEFLDWLGQNNFVFLGYREYDVRECQGQLCVQSDAASGLGILRGRPSSMQEPVPLASLPETLRQRVIEGPALMVTKANSPATVHRSARLDYVGVKKYDAQGKVCGERRFLGLFTSQALSTPVKDIPILRRKLTRVLALDGAAPGSHDYKQIVTIFNSLPREELFWAEPEPLHREIRTLMAMEQESEVRLTVRRDPTGRGLLVMVIMPRDHFNATVRQKIQDLLTRRLEARHVDYQLSMGEEEEQVRFHFYLTTDVRLESLDLEALEHDVAQLARTWEEHLEERLVRLHGDALGRRLAARYAGAFSEAYKAINPASVAASDIENLEALGDRPFRVDLLNPPEERFGTPATRLKLYHRRPDLVLSDVMPIFENLGLRVVGQTSYAVGSWGQPPQEGLALPAMIDVFRVQDRRGQPLDLKGLRANLMEAVLALLEGTAENDRLNELVLTAGLTCRQVALLRTLQMHFTQLHPGTSRRFVTDTLLAHPDCSRALFACFAARFGQGSWEETSRRYQELLAAVSSLAYDRVLRGLYELVAATVRTNYFLGKPYISCKVNSRQLEGIPEPRPLFEIAVSGPGVEGIHLRGGKVARGGIRWSDRPDDFRTEVLGLMKTQMTKNAVIVPVGAKGGFVLKKAPRAREALQQYAVEQYKIFIRGLLDLTDNIREGQVVAPAGLVIHDEPDPYLVVAADKGTATFSDVANSVAAEYDFWLGDAFASGGSHGYDHKKEGITARGAWECVRRHFREMGIVVGRDLITVAGIGDMSGDVFGNGLLYTDRLKLVAAFNHQHIFLDPDPDPLASYRERQRLFALPRSTWEDYDRSLISPGGGVYPRSAKAIPLAPPVRQMLGVEAEELSGEEVISAILRMPVDLLWNGGIGCYVKASSERHADVGDSANDAVRVNANEVRARVVGEGGNNGFTQLARIEYARLGGRINTDFIDNSAGVDMSDHEVNIKILLGPLVAAGELTSVQRNRLLEEMTDEVSQLVLRDNYRQSMSISLAWRRSRQEPALYAGLLGYLCEHGGLSRRVEFLPDDRALAERERSGEGLSRPELAILLAYTKAVLKRLLLQTDLPEEPCFQGYLTEYFPRVLGQRFPQAIARHQLRREIIATQFTNTAVDLLGMAFVHRTIRVTGASPVQVTRAALTALEILEARRLLEHLFDLDETVGAEEQYRALDLWARAVQQVTTWMLFTRANLASISEVIDTYRQPLGDFRQAMPALLPEAGQARFRAAVEEARGAGFPEEVARDLATLDYLPGAVLIVDVARLAGLPLERAAAHYYAIGERLGLSWLRARLAALPARDRWEPVAIESLITELKQLQSRMTLAALREGALRPEDFLDRHAALFERYDRTRAEMQAQEQLTLAAGDVLARQLLQVARALEDAAGEGPGWSPGRRPPGR